jgi:hypothetical protein
MLVGGLIVIVILNLLGVISLGLPSWWPIAAVIVLAGGIAGWMASDRLYSLIPEDSKIVLVAFATGDGTGGNIWKLHPDEFEDMEVDGDLYEWSESATRCYEVRDYDPDRNHATGNWRETPPASDFARQEDIESIRADIRSFREQLEPEVRKSKRLRRQIGGIIRSLDAQRDREMNRSIEKATVDSSIDRATISETLESALDDDLRNPPDAGGGDDEPDTMTGQIGGTNSWIEQDEYDAILNGDSDSGFNFNHGKQ